MLRRMHSLAPPRQRRNQPAHDCRRVTSRDLRRLAVSSSERPALIVTANPAALLGLHQLIYQRRGRREPAERSLRPKDSKRQAHDAGRQTRHGWMGALARSNRIQRRSAGSRSGRFLRRPVRIDNELFRRAFVEVTIPLRRLLQRNDGRIARFGGMNFVVQDRHHELAVVT